MTVASTQRRQSISFTGVNNVKVYVHHEDADKDRIVVSARGGDHVNVQILDSLGKAITPSMRFDVPSGSTSTDGVIARVPRDCRAKITYSDGTSDTRPCVVD